MQTQIHSDKFYKIQRKLQRISMFGSIYNSFAFEKATKAFVPCS